MPCTLRLRNYYSDRERIITSNNAQTWANDSMGETRDSAIRVRHWTNTATFDFTGCKSAANSSSLWHEELFSRARPERRGGIELYCLEKRSFYSRSIPLADGAFPINSSTEWTDPCSPFRFHNNQHWFDVAFMCFSVDTFYHRQKSRYPPTVSISVAVDGPWAPQSADIRREFVAISEQSNKTPSILFPPPNWFSTHPIGILFVLLKLKINKS